MASTRASTSKAASDPDFVPQLIEKVKEMRVQANNVFESNICNKLTGMYSFADSSVNRFVICFRFVLFI